MEPRLKIGRLSNQVIVKIINSTKMTPKKSSGVG